ncbi:MAG: CPBP family glutamic-type intramembrane protease [Gammaproteobacteria bacterium]|nr:CPBP family glutamic-type intramembrane protease [Gammaproteobacteria bacterium]
MGVVAGGIALAVVGWAFLFGLDWGNFWVKLGLTASTVALYALLWERPRIRFTAASVGVGVLSAALLYAVFYAGNALAPLIVPGAGSQVGGIYELGEGASRVAVFLLLFLVTGPAEEVFWRGFLQGRLMARLGPAGGYVAATLVYGGVHAFSGNLMLMLAALVAGAWWGAQYLWRRDLAALIVSHSLWSAVIFTVAPVTPST